MHTIGLTAQYRLEKNGYTKTGKACGSGASAATGAMIGSMAGPGGAVVGGIVGFAAWFVLDTALH